MARWPSSLPWPIGTGYQLSPLDPAHRTEMDTGLPRARRITWAENDRLQMQVRLTDAEMAAFRAWFGDRVVSLAGASDDLSGWVLTRATLTADSVTGPADTLADRLIETTGTGVHTVTRRLDPGVVGGATLLARATCRAAGRHEMRLGVTDAAGVLRGHADMHLDSGVITRISGVASARSIDRGDGWWRIEITVALPPATPESQVLLGLIDDQPSNSYTGDGTSGIDICEVQARMATGYDLYLPSDAAGRAIGAAGGSGWFLMPLAFGGGASWVEARFTGPFTATMLQGFNWQVSAPLEVRHA
ncbi:MAG: hypothetical protein IE927_09410 [Rhodobacterales bacterium]|nr:hypothetical protein [Rhodobacterales bacterium]